MFSEQAYFDRLWAKMSPGLRAQAARRLSRAQANDIEVNVLRAAGSFEGLGRQLRRENARLFAETVNMKAYHLAQIKALPLGSEIKLLAPVQRLALPFPWHFVQLGLYRMQARENLASQDRQILAAINTHCGHLHLKAKMAQHYESILVENEKYLDRICARQAKRDGWRVDGSSLLRPMDVLNPFKWIAAMFSDHKGGDS